MRATVVLRSAVLPGAAGGVVGGAVFGAAMIDLGVLPSVASIVRVESPYVGFAVNMTIAVIVGSGLGLLVWQMRPGIGETLLWGLVYGTFWWFIGTLTLHPLLLGNTVEWTAEAAQRGFPALLGHVLFGSSAGLTIVLVRWRQQVLAADWGFMFQGGIAGVLAAWTIGAVLAAQGHLPTFAADMSADSRLTLWAVTLSIGLVGGLAFVALFPRPANSTGEGIVRGAAFGFLLWVVIALTIAPLVHGKGLTWSTAPVRDVFPSMPGYVLFGATLALLHRVVNGFVRTLFSDVVAGDDEGVGTQGLRSVGHGTIAGILGGLIFTGVMVQTGAFGTVASLIGAESPVTGFFVHMAIAIIIGSSYGMLFRRQSYDLGSALGWGVSYGFIWWMLGPMTLMPAFLGTPPQWTADVAAQTFPNLVGHLGYGGALGVTVYLLEARYTPWWVPLVQADADRVARRREQIMTSGPALWAMVVVISLTLPIVLSGGGAPGVPGYGG